VNVRFEACNSSFHDFLCFGHVFFGFDTAADSIATARSDIGKPIIRRKGAETVIGSGRRRWPRVPAPPGRYWTVLAMLRGYERIDRPAFRPGGHLRQPAAQGSRYCPIAA